MKYVLLTVVLFCGFAFSFLLPFKFLLNFSNDDSFFYLKTAYNFSTGFGSTFDLVNTTNGYHPLWFLILSLYFFILNFFTAFSPEFYYRLVVFLIYIINVCTIFVVFRIYKINDFLNKGKNIVLFIPLFMLFVFTRDFGMESHLSCFIIALYLLIKSIELKSNVSFALLKCFLLMLLSLAKIDFIFTVVPVIIIFDYLSASKIFRNKCLIGSFASLLLVISIYFGSNYIFFGNLMNISGAIKNSFPHILFYENIIEISKPGTFFNQFAKIIFTFIVILIFAVFLFGKKYKEKHSKYDLFQLGVGIAVLSYILLNLTFNKHSIKEWYVAVPAFVSSLILIRILSFQYKYYNLFLIIFFAIFIFHFYITRATNPKWDNTYDYALEVKLNTEPEDRIFQIDLCGIVGFFSERKVINGDGLINSFEYQKYLNSNELDKYFHDKKINYYSTHSTEKGVYKIKERDGIYEDSHYSLSFGGYPFSFNKEDLKLKYPYYYSFVISSDKGYWYLFLIREN